MASTHYFSAGTILDSPKDPVALLEKLDRGITPLAIGADFFVHKMLLKSVDSSEGDGASKLLPFLITL